MDNVSKRLLQASCALALTATVATSAQAQSTRKDLQTGNKLFNQENYRASIPYYERVIAKDPNNAQALFRAGVAYLSFDKEKASDYIYKAQKLKPKVSKDVEYWLGRVDHLNYNFDEAITHYQAYNATLKKRSDSRREEVAQLIQHSKNAKVLFNSPKDIFVKNLGPTVNTQYAEHSPVISSDDKTLIFTTRANPADIPGLQQRAGKKDIAADGEYFEGIVETHRIDADNWEKPRSLGAALNTKGHDGSDQLFDNDTKLLMYRDDEDGDVFVSSKTQGGDWGQPTKLNSNINSKAREGDAYITPDGLTLYFSTGKYSEDNNLDLYYSTRTAGGDWGPAKSLGGAINTKEDDDSPYLSQDGKTLYFASKGHNTMGGYDIFKSKYDSIGHKWSRPENMGYPVNTPDDDSYYRLAPDGTYAYLSSYRIGGYGEKDIYTISYIKNITIKGAVFSKRDSTQAIPGVELVFNGTQADKTAISFRDVTKDPGGDYQVKVLSARTYQVAVNKDGKNIETQEFAVPISTNDSTSITKNFYVDYIDTISTGIARGMRPIYFDTDKYKLRAESVTTLNNTAAILKANTGLNISIEGNCDSRNTDEYNMVLGQNRADAAKNYLVKQGVASARLTTVSYGERKPAAPNDSPENMQLNRRDDFKVVLKEGEKMPVMQPVTSATTTTTIIAVPVRSAPPLPGKSKVKLADGTKVKTKVDEDSDKVKVKTKGAAGEKSKTVSKNGELDSKAKDASGEKAKVKVKAE
ncbi:OmpA family protein [Hymenobacter sp. H14-R3]|uniref:OmpA family protein n=1 Tax=Hymenobacter sp. H14-R3 TaxID=3046308 RepID=UPI0024BA0D09|nr:OmpA family protein [Hymenobacter sp. H14-R3]MDJ0365957.1 OmpA family protein [Hymenobacter sp. H14-R3]